MKERTQITILVVGLIILGILCVGMISVVTKFTFSASEIRVNGSIVNEKLTYKLFNKEYHTIYRNFLTPIIPSDTSKYPTDTSTVLGKDYISINKVRCSAGTAYYRDINNEFYSTAQYLEYTERNEYGCGFGETLGFKKGTTYTVSAEYILNPTKLFEYNNRTYIKFIAYSKDVHPVLIRGKNLQLNDEVLAKRIYLTSEDVVIYVPYIPENVSNYDVKSIKALEFDNNNIVLNLILAIIPAMICLFTWLKFGKENAEGDYPDEMSQNPEERKAWEVAAYFHPPFGQAGGTLLPATMIDFYNRKIIDIKEVESSTHIKILQEEPKVDDVERTILNFLKKARSESKSNDGYFCLEDINKDVSKAWILNHEYRKIQRIITVKSDEHVDNRGLVVIIAAMIIATIIFITVSGNGYMAILYAVTLIIVILSILRTSLFSKFKKNYYLEYEQWQRFKDYLSHLDSIPRTSFKGVVMWEKYLIYATALGIGKKVLEVLKKWKVIDKKQYNSYHAINTATIISSGSSASSTSGGFSGGSAGGMGGGGGGGR